MMLVGEAAAARLIEGYVELLQCSSGYENAGETSPLHLEAFRMDISKVPPDFLQFLLF